MAEIPAAADVREAEPAPPDPAEPKPAEPAPPDPIEPAPPDPIEPATERLAVAMVRGVHGLRGAVRVEILTDRPEQRYAVGSVLRREGSDAPLTITWASAVADGPGWRLQFAEVRNRSEAEALKDVYLEIDGGPDVALPRGAYFWHEVVGTTVTATDGTVLGTIQDVYRSGGAEVYVVAGGDYAEFDVPAVRDFIRIFAPRRGEIVVDTVALDLAPRRRRHAPDDPERPRAPRRRAGSRRAKAESARGVGPVAGEAPAETADAVTGDESPRRNPFDALREG
ncbi:MAG: ribosome maturation factor RimM [Candidatus Limnocylindrales bacterium]